MIGAETRDLCVMAGGDEAAYQRVKPVLDAMGDKVMYCGPIGNGTICKLSHQLFGSIMRQGMHEVLIAGAAAGVPVETLVKAISQSNAGKNPPFHNWERPAEQTFRRTRGLSTWSWPPRTSGWQTRSAATTACQWNWPTSSNNA